MPTLEWRDLEEDAAHSPITIPLGKELIKGDVRYKDTSLDTAEHKAILTRELQRCLTYAMDMLDANPFSKDGWIFFIGHRFCGAGTEVRMPNRVLEIERLEPTEQVLLRSLLVHEMMHNLRLTETLSMFAELVYLREHRGNERLQEIHDLYLHRGQPDNPFTDPYIHGYETIAKAIATTPDQLLATLRALSPSTLKERLRAYAMATQDED